MRGKKLLGIFTALLLVLVLAACTSKDSGTTPKDNSDGGKKDDGKFSGELTVWVHPFVGSELADQQSEVFEKMAADFKVENPDAKVKFEVIPWANREQKILTALAANQGPDIFYLIPDMMAQFADKGVLTPITDLLGDDWDKEDFPESSLAAVTYKDDLFGLPILHEVRANVYNTDVLKEIGASEEDVPTTWEEFDALAKKAVDKGYYARGFEGGNTLNATLYPVLWQAGGDVIDENGKVIINNEKGLKTFERINDWYKDEYIPKDSINALTHFEDFLEGTHLSSGATGLTLSTLKERKFDQYVLGPPLKGEEQATFGTTGMFVVPSNSKNKEAAAELIKYMTNTDNSMAFNELTKYIPPRKSAAGIYDDDPEMLKMTEWLEYTKPGVIHPVSRDIIPLVTAEIQAMLEGTKTPKQAADDSAAVIQGEIDKQ
ncbi:sugar ABC transporter substrate-binding protein [Bacillus sp. FSL K6-3431]|uniref:sugar ABC transporter substrate-binding protein n=1 Tax=Bacillus sp. FSL K6-3431 TaxID=2921500 RepID=UPI0030FBED64